MFDGDPLGATLEERVRQADGRGLGAVARLAAAELGWTHQRKDAKIDDVKRGVRTPGSIPEPVA